MGNAQGPFVTQKGSGRDDGPYVHSASSVGGFSGFNNPSGITFNNPLPEGVYWADINGDGGTLQSPKSAQVQQLTLDFAKLMTMFTLLPTPIKGWA